MKIIKEEQHSLLNRRQLEIELEHENARTPTREESLKRIADNLKISPELIKIKSIFTKYGKNTSRVIANVYNNLESLKSIEEFRKKQKAKKEKKAPAQAKKE
jgi:ribosomal protein S24E